MANFSIAEISINLYSPAGTKHQFSLPATSMPETFPLDMIFCHSKISFDHLTYVTK
jgi:hypothetical protein